MAELAFPGAPCARASSGAVAGRCAICAARPFSICAALPDADLARLEALAETLALARGQVLFREGDPAAQVYNVSAGSVRLSRLTPDGRRQILGFAFAGDFLGLDRRAEHLCTAEALEAATVCRFSRPRFEALLAERRDLEQALAGRAADALAAAQGQMLRLGHKTALERLASFLLTLPGCDPARPSAPGQVRLPMTRQEIADYLGLTLETVSRGFSRLKRDGLIRQVSLAEVVVERPAALLAAAGEAA
ncbi:Crp/Fnr family transcriptional regulator [Phenylobacterium sp.]|uniref:Crp/Fnr family transcriptional regulator n=1 Tax=Phenylobacterium sp. TaxID=1871053 RepID=UPI002B959F3A|nr:helix-turn-helix domain-containing protein [Phenylobacterium sp.]HLZ77083.1 helix-turn-helix domain-containing protein [Phenylobacterium sp.]